MSTTKRVSKLEYSTFILVGKCVCCHRSLKLIETQGSFKY